MDLFEVYLPIVGLQQSTKNHTGEKMTEQESDDKPTARQVDIAREMLDVIILKFLRIKPTHGYELMSKIRETFKISFGTGTIYPFLAKLEKDGDIINQWDTEKDRPRKIYALTNKGQETLTCIENDFNTFYQKINKQLTAEE
jgi:PadR family transcriptional regulator PadR